MVGWHHWLEEHEFEQARGVGDGQGNLACCSAWGNKVSDTTERLSWTGILLFSHNNNKRKPNLPFATVWMHLSGKWKVSSINNVWFTHMWSVKKENKQNKASRYREQLATAVDARGMFWSLDQEESLEEEMATHSSIPAWKYSMVRGTWQGMVHEVTKSWTWLSTHVYKNTHKTFRKH